MGADSDGAGDLKTIADLTITLITAVTYGDVKDEVFALPKAVKAAVAEKKGHAQ